MTYYQVLVSAEDKRQAHHILDALLAKRLILGGPILEGPAKFWWKGKIVEMNYAYIVTFTTDAYKDEVIKVASAASEEECPMLSFVPFEGNDKLLQLIDQTLGSAEK